MFECAMGVGICFGKDLQCAFRDGFLIAGRAHPGNVMERIPPAKWARRLYAVDSTVPYFSTGLIPSRSLS